MKDTIIIPTYNERENISPLVKEIFDLLPDTHILVVDDSSPDGTAEVVKSLMVHYANLSLHIRKTKEGLGAAYKDVLKKLAGDGTIRNITTMDADGSHSPDYLPLLLKESVRYDLVIGSRYIKGGGVENWEPWRYMLSKYGNIYARMLTGLPVQDLTAGFVCFKRDLLDKIDLDAIGSGGYAYQIEFKFHCVKQGATIKEIPIIFKNRREGESKMSNHIIREGLKTPLKLFFLRLKG